MEDMTFIPSENPGAFERHLIRRNNNPLFEDRQTEINSDSLMEVQKKDHDILQKFMVDVKETMTKAVTFKPNEDSEVILAIKDQLDKLYATSVSVADDQTRVKESIKKLLTVIMQSVRQGAGNDAHALQELEQEEGAREANFEFLESKLVADILDPDSPIDNDDLVPTLLSIKDKDELALATQLFDLEQVTFLLGEGETLLNKLDAAGEDVKEAAENFVFVEGYKQYLEQQG
jgi:seryl-tRNA synthetase